MGIVAKTHHVFEHNVAGENIDSDVLRKQRQALTGLILLGGLIIYFLIRASVPDQFQWPGFAKLIALISGAIGGAFVAWLVLHFSKASSKLTAVLVPIVFVWFFLFGLFLWAQPSVTIRWEFFIYMLVALAGTFELYEGLKKYCLTNRSQQAQTPPESNEQG